MAVKSTSNLIPLCHPLPITKIKVDFKISQELNKIETYCTVECDYKTGIEMEAMTGATVSLLTIYDMCKAVDKKMIISNCKVIEKLGGKSGDFKID
ncbi:hypothetical protein B5S28_g2740 [[Candida] boidinii]|uniref:Unnamed protein product n=1 Tax=Candida boidinii TaxID=5477 RepID=A0ACB5U8X9_CANBO|nr:hypothetical protein B5S28_g2740 [[Candida] boidinii]OWB59470.1 hypothetical protein B5S29_g328 [[Candida] boidinii]OWB71694.1 hypothetical protein B5S31_g1385 [[Candida] boidinii]OWB76423.1 hypothetical protein B5S32_g574 [[Candida] boidinii]GME94493.1 unnamed protein product [[Candida] boidinii]